MSSEVSVSTKNEITLAKALIALFFGISCKLFDDYLAAADVLFELDNGKEKVTVTTDGLATIAVALAKVLEDRLSLQVRDSNSRELICNLEVEHGDEVSLVFFPIGPRLVFAIGNVDQI